MRALTLAGTVALVTLAGACAQPDHVAGSAVPVTTAPSATAPSAAAPSASTAPSSPTGTTTTGKAPVNTPAGSTDPCPVNALTLYSVLLHNKPSLWKGGTGPSGVTKPSCYKGFAYTRLKFDVEPNAEIPWVLFHFDAPHHAWEVLSTGTGGVCDGFVSSQAIRDRLNKNTGGGC